MRKVIDQMNRAKHIEGRNGLDSVNGLKLFATIRRGMVQKLTVTNALGKDLPISTMSADAKCFACVKEGAGPKTCWEMDCEDLPRSQIKTQ